MSVVSSFAARTLAANRVRTAVTVAGIALSAALLTAVLTSVNSAVGYLYDQELQYSGAWQAQASATDAAAVDAARADEGVEELTAVVDVGFAQLDEADAYRFGEYLTVRGIDGGFSDLLALQLTDGRLPESSDEIVLQSIYRDSTVFSDEPLAVGDTVTIALGQRKAVPKDGADAAADDGEALPEYLDSMQYNATDISSMYDEELANVGEAKTYTVVGFYSLSSNALTFAPSGTGALTYVDEGTELFDGALRLVFFTGSNVGSDSDLKALGQRLFGQEPTLHMLLLMYQGVSSSRELWTSLYLLAAVLAATILAASVALIYNAFAISVAERTRQFGLLASAGASRRQIRGFVLTEACILAAVGVPAGLLAGVGGTYVVFAALEPAFSALSAGAQFGVRVSVPGLMCAAAFAFLAVLASAWVPAFRASRVSAVDAVRNARDVRATKAVAGSVDAGDPWRARGASLASRLGGIPGALAHRNATRAKGKGRVATVSLALAVVLVVAAGVVDQYLGLVTKATGVADHGYDVYATVLPAEGTTSEQLFDLYDEMLAQIDGTEGTGASLVSYALVNVPESMVGEALDRSVENGTAIRRSDGSVDTYALIHVIDGELYRDYLEQVGLDADACLDGSRLLAVANAQSYSGTGQKYSVLDMLAGTGTVGVYSFDAREGCTYMGPGEIANGECAVYFSDDETGELLELPLEGVGTQTIDVAVGALADELPAVVGPQPYDLAIMLPESAAGALDLSYVSFAPYFQMTFAAQDHAAVCEVVEEYLGSKGASMFNVTSVADVAASEEETRLLLMVVNVFSLLFAGILALIAVANVFNTVSSNMALRRREFAMLRSVGMGNGAFLRMVAWECLRYCLYGLAIGLALATALAYGAHVIFEPSFEGLGFTLPWVYVVAAAAGAAAVTTVSTAYGLARARRGTVVEALRADVL